MPRKARLEMPGDIHHVMANGLNGEYILKADTDKTWFLNKLEKTIKSTQCRCYAWVLMDTHYHLLLRPGFQPLSAIMRKINTGYAQYYNRVHNRHGYLFQDRYKSIPTREINYFKELVCYIHLNPLRGGIVKTIYGLNSYNWRSHRGFTGRQEFPWMHLNDALLHFGYSLEEGQKQYFKYLALVLEKCQNQDECFNPWMNSSNVGLPNNKVSDDNVSERDPEFVVASVKKYNNHLRRRRELLKQGWNVERLVNHVSTLFKLSKHDILSNTKKKKVVNARSLIYYWAIDVLGLSAISVARYFGHSCSTAIRSAEKGKVLAEVAWTKKPECV